MAAVMLKLEPRNTVQSHSNCSLAGSSYKIITSNFHNALVVCLRYCLNEYQCKENGIGYFVFYKVWS